MDAIETETIVTTAEMFEIVGNELKEKNAEIERLREALTKVVVYHDGFTLTIEEVVASAREALKEKE